MGKHERLFGWEIVVSGAERGLRELGDVAHRGRVEPPFSKGGKRRSHDPFAGDLALSPFHRYGPRASTVQLSDAHGRWESNALTRRRSAESTRKNNPANGTSSGVASRYDHSRHSRSAHRHTR